MVSEGWNETDKCNETCNDCFRPVIKTGMMALWQMMISILHGWVWIFPEERQSKEKERKERKERMMKANVGSQEMEKANQFMSNLWPHRLLLIDSCSSTPAQQQQQEEEAHYPSAASSSSSSFSGTETDPARVDVLEATFEEQEHKRRTRCGGQNWRDEAARQNREEGNKFPVLVGDVGALRSALRQRAHPVPREVGLQPLDASLKPDEKGISCCMRGYSNYVQILSQFECSKNLLEPTEDQSAFSFPAARPVQVCGNGPAFHNENSMPPAVCILDLGCARALGSRKAFEAFCSMLAHIQTVAYGMKFNQQVQDSSLKMSNNPNALGSLWYSSMIMDGTLSSQSSASSKKVMFHCFCNF